MYRGRWIISSVVVYYLYCQKSGALGTAILHRILLNYTCLLSPFAPKTSLRLWKGI